MIYAGDLKQRLTIQSPTETLDADTGQPTRTWSAFASSLPCKVESVTGGEMIRGRTVAATATTLFTVRWLSGVTTKMRVQYESRTLYIVRAGDPYGDRRELRIECKEGSDG